jgi:hypothetical protein
MSLQEDRERFLNHAKALDEEAFRLEQQSDHVKPPPRLRALLLMSVTGFLANLRAWLGGMPQ